MMEEDTPLCHINDIPEDDSRGFSYRGLNIIAVKKNGQLYLYQNSCPHLGIPLEWQEHQFLNHDKSLIQCNTHGALFTIDTGACISGPCEGSHLQQIHYCVEKDYLFLLK